MPSPPFCLRGFLLAALFAPFILSAQVRGRITDPQGTPLAFVSVLPNDETGKVAISDIEGYFKVDKSVQVRTLTFRYVGFETLYLDSIYLELRAGQSLTAVLQPVDFALPEAVIRAGENPADILIRRAIAHRERNNPERYASFICNTYNKVAFDALPNRVLFQKMLSKRDSSANRVKEDIASFERVEKAMQEHHFLFMESVTERRFKAPNQNQERVLLNRVSGFKDMGMVSVANSVQPFSFYGDYLRILDKDFVNPISPGSPNLYFFNIEDTLYAGPDTVWVISFRPRKGKVFDALEGVLHLNSFGWAVQNVRAHPAKSNGILTMKIEQAYRLVEGGAEGLLDSVGRIDSFSGRLSDSMKGINPPAPRLRRVNWFPSQLNFEIELPRYPDPHTGLRIAGRSFIDSVRIGAPLRSRDFIPEMPIYLEPAATTSPAAAWDSRRSGAPLTRKEERTYEWMDSLSKRRNLDRISKIFNYVVTGKAPLAHGVSLDLRQLLKFNQFENTRIGLGLTTAESRPMRLPKRVELGASVGYGIGDQAFKYGGSALWRVSRFSQTQFRVGWQRDLLEPGALHELPRADFVNRTIYAQKMDYSDEWSAVFGSNLWQGARMELAFRRQLNRPNYDYGFGAPDAIVADRFHFTESTVFFRYAADERGRSFLGSVTDVINKIPILELAYTRGWKDVWQGDFNYDRWTLALHQSFFIRRLGRMRWRLEAGMVTAETPVAKLFTLNQTSNNAWSQFVVRNTFQSLPDTLFLADRFVNVYWSQEVGPVLYQTKRSAPHLTLLQNMAWGDLRRPDLQHALGFRVASRPLLESGLQLDNLLRFNYLNFAYLGVGGAVFYRWGGLDSGAWKQNFVPRLSMKFTFG